MPLSSLPCCCRSVGRSFGCSNNTKFHNAADKEIKIDHFSPPPLSLCCCRRPEQDSIQPENDDSLQGLWHTHTYTHHLTVVVVDGKVQQRKEQSDDSQSRIIIREEVFRYLPSTLPPTHNERMVDRMLGSSRDRGGAALTDWRRSSSIQEVPRTEQSSASWSSSSHKKLINCLANHVHKVCVRARETSRYLKGKYLLKE